MDQISKLADSRVLAAIGATNPVAFRAYDAPLRRELHAEVAALRKDAERFRLLLDGPHNFGVFVCGEDGSPHDSISNDELKAALDGLLAG